MIELTEREKLILEEIVRHYIQSATPVSSALIARNRRLGMSAATVRNIMASLEQKGCIHQPHTSAGRVPNTHGYRIYVDTLMHRSRLTTEEKEQIRQSIQESEDATSVLRTVSGILAQLSHQLSIIVSPSLDDSILDRMELIPVSSETLLVIVTLSTGMVKTITFKIDADYTREHLVAINQTLNERLHGLALNEIRRRFGSIVSDLQNERTGVIQLLKHGADRLFDFNNEMRLYVMGTHYIVRQPDFSDLETISTLVRQLENGEILLHLNPAGQADPPVSIRIGEEIDDSDMREFSIVTARYRIGSSDGTLGILGPMRMNYSKMVTLLDYTARSITTAHG